MGDFLQDFFSVCFIMNIRFWIDLMILKVKIASLKDIISNEIACG